MKLNEILIERLYVKDGEIVVSIQTDKEASTEDAISTYINKKPYTSTDPEFPKAKVYSLFNYITASGDKQTGQILSSIKQRGPYKFSSKMAETFFKLVNKAGAPVVKNLNPDVIIYGKSSSGFVKDFIKALDINPKIKVLDDAFIKRLLKAEDVEVLMNTKHEAWEKFSKENPAEVKLFKQSLVRMIQKHGEIELKSIFKKYAKFITNFLDLEKASDVLDEVIGKKVLVIDDVYSSGATMLEMIRKLQEFEPSEINGLTVFKNASK